MGILALALIAASIVCLCREKFAAFSILVILGALLASASAI